MYIQYEYDDDDDDDNNENDNDSKGDDGGGDDDDYGDDEKDDCPAKHDKPPLIAPEKPARSLLCGPVLTRIV